MQKTVQLNPVAHALLAATLSVTVLLAGFFLAEPVVGHAITDNFTIKQTIDSELSFATNANDVVMDTNINSITGGSSLGTSTVAVRTNNPTGYTLSINFASTTAMHHDSVIGSIPNYTPAASGVPDNWAIAANSAEFGYSVIAPSVGDIDPRFEDDGATCGSGGSTNTFDECWYQDADATTVVDLVNSSSPTNSGTTTIRFQVEVGANPAPAVAFGAYTATATLTLLDN
jgi:hypothetical protein